MSLFTHEQRFFQTLKTIASLRHRVENSYIILCDNSPLTEEQKYILTYLVDKIILLHDDEPLYREIEPTRYNEGLKSRGEAYQMLNIIEFIKDKEYDLFFKISGRYFLNNDFNLNNFNNQKLNFREFSSGCFNKKYVSTVLYAISKRCENVFKSKLIEIIPDLHPNTSDIETSLHSLCEMENIMNKVDYLGVCGYISDSNHFASH